MLGIDTDFICLQPAAIDCWCGRWKAGITHVVLPSLVRSVKSLAGMAAGRWILHADFVEASASAEALVDPVSMSHVTLAVCT